MSPPVQTPGNVIAKEIGLPQNVFEGGPQTDEQGNPIRYTHRNAITYFLSYDESGVAIKAYCGSHREADDRTSSTACYTKLKLLLQGNGSVQKQVTDPADRALPTDFGSAPTTLVEYDLYVDYGDRMFAHQGASSALSNLSPQKAKAVYLATLKAMGHTVEVPPALEQDVSRIEKDITTADRQTLSPGERVSWQKGSGEHMVRPKHRRPQIFGKPASPETVTGTIVYNFARYRSSEKKLQIQGDDGNTYFVPAKNVTELPQKTYPAKNSIFKSDL